MTRIHPLLFLVLLSGCSPPPTPTPVPPPPADPQPLEAEGLHNLFRVSDRVYSGSSPDGDAGFESLKHLGVKTVLSVDGATPEVAAAEKHGLRYVHLPIGYHGISPGRAAELAKAVRDLPGPVYIHCHHGKHRGPAACAVVQLALDPAWTPAVAERWLATAGTDPKYVGLHALARTAPPAAADIDAIYSTFPSVAPVATFVALMVDVDFHWEHLKLAKVAGWKSPTGHPDIDPPHEAVQLAELYREGLRLPEVSVRGEKFSALMTEAETAANELEKAIRAKDDKAAGAAFTRAQTACTKCHEQFRDRK